jgi:hypothetical protein
MALVLFEEGCGARASCVALDDVVQMAQHAIAPTTHLRTATLSISDSKKNKTMRS